MDYYKDNGKGLNKDKILKKAKDNGLLKVKENDLTDREIYSMIFLPGFSTKENVYRIFRTWGWNGCGYKGD